MTTGTTVLLVGGGVLAIVLIAKRRETFPTNTGRPQSNGSGVSGLTGMVNDFGDLVGSVKDLWGKTFGDSSDSREYDISGHYAG